jgi:hypothetical protein
MGEARGFEVLTTEAEWVRECHGVDYCPKLKCKECKEVVTRTRIGNLRNLQSLGCTCRKKTETKLRSWLETKFPEATVNTQYCGPKTEHNRQTHFDFHLAFSDGFEVLIELDGPQHFWIDTWRFNAEGCQRDLDKEEWAIAKGLSVVRVLQEDVWDDRLGWDRHLLRSVGASRSQGPGVFTTPGAPEYTSTESSYVRLRRM